VKDYSLLTSYMNTQKYFPVITWSQKMREDFQTLKDTFSKGPIQAAPYFDKGEELKQLSLKLIFVISI